MNAPAIGVTALFALAAMLGLLGPGTALAQNPEAKAGTKTSPAQHKPRRPGVKPAAKDRASKQNAPEQGATAAKSSTQEPDLAYGAFQRGYFFTAFAVATKRVEEKDDVSAMTLLGELYATGLGVPQNEAKAAEWYKFAAQRGDRNAMFALAMFSLQGRAGPRDRDASAKWFAAAAKLGHPLAAYNLALLYMEGQLFPQDFGRAAELLRVAAKAGNPEAQYALGTLYKEGRGVPKDMSEAVRLWSLASVADNTDAQVEYAIALYNGDGVAKNEVAAAALFRRAALRGGSPIAQDRLARILATGRGAPANPVEATKWHLISKARGETNLELDDFVNNLDADTRAAGEKAAKPWLDVIKRRPS
jgi:TPR repeat protein